MAALYAPAAATASHATPTPLTSLRKHPIAMCHSPKVGGGNQRARLAASASPQARALAPAAEQAAGPAPVNVDYLTAEFAGHGVSFEPLGGSCAVKMTLSNGSAAHVLLPSGLVTSYKPAMWHGTVTEVLHTNVGEGPRGRAVIRGGVHVDLRCAGVAGAGGWSPSGKWSLRDVRGNPTTSIEIELAAAAPGNAVEARCVVKLLPEALATELSLTNSAASASPVALSCRVSNHLRVSTPDATYALGLQGSDYRSVEPALSEFSIIPPDYKAAPRGSAAGAALHRWANKGFDMVLSPGDRGRGTAAEPDGEEDDDYKHMTDEMCRIYSQAPREFTIIDRGRRNSVCLQRKGFEELYVFSPGCLRGSRACHARACDAAAWTDVARGSIPAQPESLGTRPGRTDDLDRNPARTHGACKEDMECYIGIGIIVPIYPVRQCYSLCFQNDDVRTVILVQN